MESSNKVVVVLVEAGLQASNKLGHAIAKSIGQAGATSVIRQGLIVVASTARTAEWNGKFLRSDDDLMSLFK